MDARPSDAVALAVRLDCPIFATDEVMVQAGIEGEQGSQPKMPKAPRSKSAAAGESKTATQSDDPALARASREELEARWQAMRQPPPPVQPAGGGTTILPASFG